MDEISRIAPVRRIKKITGRRLVEFACSLCDAVRADAGAMNMRGGIFPDNIAVDPADRIELGAARPSGWDGQELEFLAPELYWDGSGSAASDVYSLGLVMYYAATGGEMPLGGGEQGFRRRMNGESFPAPEGVSRRLGETILKAAAFRAAERYGSVGALKATLESCLEDGSIGGGVFKKDESELSDYEKMMLSIISSSGAEDEGTAEFFEEAAIEEPPAEDRAPAEQSTPAEQSVPAEQAPVETESEEEAAVMESPVEDTPIKETPAEETPAEETPAEETPAGDAVIEEAPAGEALETGAADTAEPDSDMKIAKDKPSESKRERIPLLVEDMNPELEPVVLTSPPSVQYKRAMEREKNISRKVRRHRRRSGLIVVALCVALILVAFLYNGFVNKTWGVLEKPEPTPEEPVVAVTPRPTPVPTPEPTPEPPKEHTYTINNVSATWTEAQQLCRTGGGYLVVINTREELDKITAMADEQGIECLWIGCRRDTAGNGFVWENDETVDAEVDPNSAMLLWGSEEPSRTDGDGTPEDYIMLWKFDGRWTYWDCRNDLPTLLGWGGRIAYVCEFEN